MATLKVNDENFDTEVLKSSKPIVVDFWAEWCGPCKMIAPILEEIANEQKDTIRIAKVNVDNDPELARRFEVMSIPTLIVFKESQPVKRIVGAKAKHQLLEELTEL